MIRIYQDNHNQDQRDSKGHFDHLNHLRSGEGSVLSRSAEYSSFALCKERGPLGIGKRLEPHRFMTRLAAVSSVYVRVRQPHV